MKSLTIKQRVVLSALALTAGGAMQTARGQSHAAAVPKLAEQEFKNIQALKGIPADQIFPAMQFITASLGVDCEHCHVREGREMKFDKDGKKPKVTARKMMQMMSAINKENFEGKRKVTCYSCHRGAPDPVGTPIIADEAPAFETAKLKKPADSSDVLPEADKVLEKYLVALGGADALKKTNSRVEKGTLSAFGAQRLLVEVYEKAPDKSISIMHLPNGDSVTAFDGHSGWLSAPGRPPHLMNSAENEAAGIDADFYFPLHIKMRYQKFTVAAGEKIMGHDTILVAAGGQTQPPVQLYFDSGSGLLLRLIRYEETPLGRNPTQIDYSDYREADGIKVPFRWTLARPGNRFTIQIEQLQHNVLIDDAKFIAPAARAEQKPGER